MNASTSTSLELVQRVLRELDRELRPHRSQPLDVRPHRALERDLQLDSLGRVELVSRLERAAGVRLPQQAVAEAETVDDLRAALDAAPRGEHAPLAPSANLPVGEAVPYPVDAETLVDVLDWHADRHPDRVQIHLYGDDEQAEAITFAALRAGARRVAAGLIARGIEPGHTVALMFPTDRGFIEAFFGVLIAGGVPVPLYPPARPSQLEAHLRRQVGILTRAEARLMLTVDQVKRLGLFLESQVPTLAGLATVDEVAADDAGRAFPRVDADAIAFLQFTSGSTGNPKGVVLTHANLLANMRAIGGFVQPTPDDVFVSWLPLYHDMGLIGAVFTTFYHAVPLVLMSPLAFLTRPQRWLEAMHRHRGTLSAAPNFAYALCTRKVPDALLDELDLSPWRMTLNGAEPISRVTYEAFAERFARCGYRSQTMTPTYGLAECSLALAMTPLAREPRVDRVDREAFSASRRAAPAAPDDADALEFVACGSALAGHELRVVDPDTGRELPERREGRLQFRGPSATAGYYRDADATARLLTADGWLDSGDLAYLAGGELHVTGRIKDVIIRAGRNVYPHELEEAVSGLEGVRAGCVAVFAAADAAAHTEKLVVLAETRLTDGPARAALEQQIRELSQDLLGAPADDVVLARPQTVLKTSSGKIRRAACRELYEAGTLGGPSPTVWWQLARLTATGWRYAARRRVERVAETAYGGHFWSQFAGHLFGAWIGAVLGPSEGLRWAAARHAARSFLRVNGLTPRVTGQLPDEAAVLVVNHASYLDGIVLAAVIPGAWAPVVKHSLRDQKVMGVLLRRLGALFVDRFDASAGRRDAQQLPAALAAGRPVAVFPEGTCLRREGLLPFQLGAFQAAAHTGAPLVPLVIRGTRSALRPDQWWPRRGPIEVEVGEVLRPSGSDFSAAVALRDEARSWILARVGEPDLAGMDVRSHLQQSGVGRSNPRDSETT